MPTYRVYMLRNNRLASWVDIDAPDDLAAIASCQEHRGDHHLELWFDRRKITSFPAEVPELASATG
jgi:hypothetical protein